MITTPVEPRSVCCQSHTQLGWCSVKGGDRDQQESAQQRGEDGGAEEEEQGLAEQEPGTTADMILACLDTQRLSLACGGELSDSVHRVLPLIALGITGQQQWR